MLLKSTVSTIAVIAAITSASALSNQAYAQGIDSDTPLDEIIVTATRTAKHVDKVTASVVVISKADIEKLAAQTVKDIFNNTPGLVVQYGTFPAASAASKSSISIRGLGATGTLWLIDGRRLSGEVKNPYDMDRLSAAMIERVEIIKGPMSALYGADAIGGVVNIITKRPKQGLQGSVGIRHGANSDGDAKQTHINGYISGAKGAISGSLYGGYQDTSPYTERETTNTRLGGGRHTPSQIPPMPGFLNPNGPTGGRPFYFHGPGQVRPQPLNPALVPGDRAASLASFNVFRNMAMSQIQDHYEVDVSYREASEVYTLGGRLELEASENLTFGIESNWFKEEREGTYRTPFHPTAFAPPGGTKANPIVGHRPDGTPIFFAQAQGRALGRIPAWDVPVRSRDNNERLDIGGDIEWRATEDFTAKLRVYHSDYSKRNNTTMLEFADFNFPNEAASAASGMSANVGITSYEAMAHWNFHSAHTLTFGGEYRDEEREATVFKNAAPGEDPFSTRAVDYKAMFVQDEWEIMPDFNITLGGRWDEYTQKAYEDGNGQQRDEVTNDKITMRLGAVKNFSEPVNIRAVFAQGYRVPDIRELFIQKRTPAGMQLGAQAVQGNMGKSAHELAPEDTNAYELSLFGASGSFKYEVTWFYNDIVDRIEQLAVDSNGDGRDDYFSFFNVGDATTQGVELTLGWQPTDTLDLDFFWTELSTENKQTGQSLFFNPDRVIAVGAQWQVLDRLRLNTRATYSGEQLYMQNGQEITTDSYTLVNVNAAWALDDDGKREVYIGVDNLFDAKVAKRIGSNPGPFLYMGARVGF